MLLGRCSDESCRNILQYITQSVLPDYECECQQGHHCTDMIFVAHQLVKKTRKLKSTFVLFIDLNALW